MGLRRLLTEVAVIAAANNSETLSEMIQLRQLDEEEEEEEYPNAWYYGYVAATIVLAFAFVWLLLFLASLLLSRKVRNDAFDLYVLMLVLPDALIVGELLVTTFQKVLLGPDIGEDPVVSDRAQPFHDFCHVFYYAANFYLNALIIYEIFQLLQSALQLRRYAPPSPRRVVRQSAAVFGGAAVYALWWVLDVPWAASYRDPETGRIEGSGSDVFAARAVTAVHTVLMALPVVYMFGVFAYIYVRQLLKPTGRTRQLYLYFLRIIVAYVLFYIPGVVVHYLEENLETASANLEFYAGLAMDFMFPLQAMVTLVLALTKEDIRTAWNDFWGPVCGRRDDETAEQNSSSKTSSMGGRFWNMAWKSSSKNSSSNHHNHNTTTNSTTGPIKSSCTDDRVTNVSGIAESGTVP